MVVCKGDHNHHGRSYVIQLTNNGRCISRNRCHIKPTTITADTYLQHQAKTPSNKTTDPLAEILNNINNNPGLYATAWVTTTARTSHQYEEQNYIKSGQKEADISGYHKDAENMQEKRTVHISTRSDPAQVNEVIQTRSECVIKNPDRLTYI